MGRVLEIVQWVLLVLIILYLIVGTYFVISFFNSINKAVHEVYTILSERQRMDNELEVAKVEAKECKVSDDCVYGKFVYEGDSSYTVLSGKVLSFTVTECVSKDKVTSFMDLPEGMVCSCVDKKCASIT